MALSYPLSLPSTSTPAAITIRGRSSVGMSASPFSFSQQVYAHQGDAWEADIELPPMKRAAAEEWVAFLLGLNGMEGTFLMGDPVNTSPRGTWNTGTPLVNGASQTGRTLVIDGISGKTAKAGDWFQLGSGSSARLHKVVQDLSGNGSLEIWPRLRSSPVDNDPLTVTSPVGLWRLASNTREYSIGQAQIYGIRFSAIEAL
jgi:hypothetical protein